MEAMTVYMHIRHLCPPTGHGKASEDLVVVLDSDWIAQINGNRGLWDRKVSL